MPLLYLGDIQIGDMETIMLPHPIPDLIVGHFAFRTGQIQLLHIELDVDMVLCSRKFGQ